jgi:hypothetical protein
MVAGGCEVGVRRAAGRLVASLLVSRTRLGVFERECLIFRVLFEEILVILFARLT